MKRRRVITFGSVLAVLLAVATLAYTARFLIWAPRGQTIRAVHPIPTFFNALVSWESRLGTLGITEFDSSISLSLKVSYPCTLCGANHSVHVNCQGEPDLGANTKRAKRVSKQFGTFRCSTLTWEMQELRVINVSTWFPAALLGCYPAIYFLVVGIRRYRRRPGHCVQCDYDLTGNESGVCPECGTAVVPLKSKEK